MGGGCYNSRRLYHYQSTNTIKYETDSGEVSIEIGQGNISSIETISYKLYAVLGIIKVRSTNFLLIVIEAEKVKSNRDVKRTYESNRKEDIKKEFEVFKVKEVAFIELIREEREGLLIDEATHLEVENLKLLLEEGQFYYTVDETAEPNLKNSLIWNKSLRETFIKNIQNTSPLLNNREEIYLQGKNFSSLIKKSGKVKMGRRSPFSVTSIMNDSEEFPITSIMNKDNKKMTKDNNKIIEDNKNNKMTEDNKIIEDIKKMNISQFNVKISHKLFSNIFNTSADFLLGTLFCGYCEEVTTYKHNIKHTLSITSYISTKRIGPRMLSRGVNEDGHSSFYVETTFNMIQHKGDLCKAIYDFDIIRASVPLYWSQHDPLSPMKIWFDESEEVNEVAFGKHISLLSESEKKVVVVDLLGRRKYEAILSKMFREFCIKHKISYINFKLHDYLGDYEIMKNKFHSQLETLISSLFNNLSKDDDAFSQSVTILDNEDEDLEIIEESSSSTTPNYSSSFSGVDDDGEDVDDVEGGERECIKQEDGDLSFKAFTGDTKNQIYKNLMVRVNCLDCLDRTNLCQYLVFDYFTPFKFSDSKKMWKRNGDALARMYTGSNALMGDILSSKKKLSFYNKVSDMYTNAHRMLNNKFTDKDKEKSINLLLQKK